MLRNYLKFNSQRPKFIVISFNLYAYLKGKPKPEYLYEFLPGNADIFVHELGFGNTAKCLIPTLRAKRLYLNIVARPSLLFHVKNDRQKRYHLFKSTLMSDQIDSDLISKAYLELLDQTEREKKYQFSAGPFARKYLNAILEMASKNKIKVIYAVPTSPEHLYEIYSGNGELQKYKDFIYSFETRYQDLMFFDFQRFLGRKELYQDPFHLNKEGSNLLSTLISEKINELR